MCYFFDFLRWLIPCNRKREESGDCGDYKAIVEADCHGHGEYAILEEEVVRGDDGKAESGAKHEQIQNNQRVLAQDSGDEASIIQNNSLCSTPIKLVPSVFEDKVEDEDHQECQYATSAISPTHFVEKLQSPSESNEELLNDVEIVMPNVQDTDVHQICLAQSSPSFSSEQKSPFVSEESEEEMAGGQISCSSQTTSSLQNVEEPGQVRICPVLTYDNRSLHDSNILPTQAPLVSNSFIPPETMLSQSYNYHPYHPSFDPNSSLYEAKEMPQEWHGNQLPIPYGYSDGWNYHWSSMPLAHPNYFTYACVSPYSIVPQPTFLGMPITMPLYDGSELFMRMIENDEVPDVLKMPLSCNTYRAYFAALLHAEDCYSERWGNFTLQRISVELHESFQSKKISKEENRTYVALNIAKFSERRPYLLSRDFVYLKPSGQEIELFEGRVARVVKGTLILVEFEDDFYSQHVPENKYDIKFSFNRMCLRRCHQAIAVAADPLFHDFTFPDPRKRIYQFIPTSISFHKHKLGHKEIAAIDQIMSLSDSLPYLIAGQLCLTSENTLSRTGMVIREAIIQIYTVFPNSRILLASPRNNTCDLLMESLRDTVPDHDMFRANAAFKEQKDLSDDIVDVSSNDGDKSGAYDVPNFFGVRLISSTFIGSSKLVEEGIGPGYFSHIFLLDASSATEPEIMVTLVSMASANAITAVVVTGSIGDCPYRLRSNIARKYGLKRSYLHRLLEMPPYSDHDPLFVTYFFDMLASSCK